MTSIGGIRGRVIVTGGAGLIGADLCHSLLATDAERIVAIDPRLTPSKEMPNVGPRFRWVREVLDSPQATSELQSANYVFHLASSTEMKWQQDSPLRDVTQGLALTLSVLEAVRSAPLRRFVYCSSSAVYGLLASSPVPVNETAGPLIPCSTYGASKLASEGWLSAYAQLAGFDATICRLGNVVSEFLDRGALVDIGRQMLAHPDEIRVLGSGEQARTYLSTSQCAAALVYLAALPMPQARVEVFNVSGMGLVTTRELVSVVAKHLGFSPRVTTSGHGHAGWSGDVPVVNLEIGKLIGAGWQATRSIDALSESAVGLLARLSQMVVH
jgi:UDP-glucose 4-epimerase